MGLVAPFIKFLDPPLLSTLYTVSLLNPFGWKERGKIREKGGVGSASSRRLAASLH